MVQVTGYIMENNILKFPKRKYSNVFKDPAARTISVVPWDWQDICNEKGKRLSHKAIQTLWVIKRLTECKNVNKIEISYEELMYEGGLSYSKESVYRHLKELVAAQVINYEIKKGILTIEIPKDAQKKLGSIKNILKEALEEYNQMNDFIAGIKDRGEK